MAYHRVEDGPWPVGTQVAVWPAAAVNEGGVPTGSPIYAAVASANGVAEFGGLTEGGTYTAFGHGGTQTFTATNQEARLAALEGGAVPVYEQPNQPATAQTGALWIDTDDPIPPSGGRVNLQIVSEDARAFLNTQISEKAAAGGGPLYLSRTTYEISDTIAMADGVYLDGEDTTIKARAGFPPNAPGAPSRSLVDIAGIQRSGFRGKIKLDGNQLAQSGMTIIDSSDIDFPGGSLEICNIALQPGDPSATAWGARVQENCQRITFERPYIHHLWSGAGKATRGILVSCYPDGPGGPRACKILDATMEEIGPGFDADGIVVQGFTDTADVQVLGGSFYRMYKRAVKLQSPGCKVKGITVLNPFPGTGGLLHDVDPILYSAVSVYASNAEVEGVTALGGAWNQGIDVGAPGFTYDGIRVAGCNFVGGAGAALATFDGIRTYGTVHDLGITDNRVQRARYGIHVTSQGENYTIEGNRVDGANVSGSRLLHIGGNASVYPTQVTMTNNVGRDLFSGGITWAGGSGYKLANNSTDLTTTRASAATTQLPAEHDHLIISGTTTITDLTLASCTGAPLGLVKTLQFSGTLTVTHGTGNIELAGAANFAATPGDTLTLSYDGTDWREIARSVI